MSRIKITFKNLKTQNKKALITYIVAGDPSLEQSLNYMHECVAGGADIIELGMPFTDPMADGPTIQAAHLRALAVGATLKTTLTLITKFRETNSETPIVLMGYANPIHAYGIDLFFKDAAHAGADGVLIVDVPPEEDRDWVNAATAHNIDFIRLLTPTSNQDRIKKITAHASGFLYYVSIAGITGTASAHANDISTHVNLIKDASVLPLVIGFGIKTKDDVERMSALADGVVIGSALIESIQNGEDLAGKISGLRN